MKTLSLALVHHPVIDRAGDIVTSTITNLDLHDLARSAHTYGLEALYVVHPIEAQRELCRRIRRHWVEGSGARRIPDRRAPLAMIRIVERLSDVGRELPRPLELWATSARSAEDRLSHAEARGRLARGEGSVVILLGTGWGLAGEALQAAGQVLEPIGSLRSDHYNHLSVRAAAAILLDRLLAPPRAIAGDHGG